MRNYKKIKIFILFIVIAVIIFSIPAVKAETNNTVNTIIVLNQQLIILLQQLLDILTKQVEELQKQLIVQQQIIEDLKTSTSQTTSSIQQILNEPEPQPSIESKCGYPILGVYP